MEQATSIEQLAEIEESENVSAINIEILLSRLQTSCFKSKNF